MNSFKLTYSVGGHKKTADATNRDIVFNAITTENKTTVKIKAKKDLVLHFVTSKNIFKVSIRDRLLLNGYQSWTDTKEFTLFDYVRNVKLHSRLLVNRYSFDSYGDVAFYKYAIHKLHGYDVFYSRGENEIFLLNDNYKTAFLVFEIDRRNGNLSLRSDFDGVELKAGEEFTVLSYYRELDVNSGMALLDELYPEKEVKKIFGYTSWYNHYQNINEEIVLKNLDAVDERFNLFQIDDGFETFVGDWLDVDDNKFPNGLKGIVDKTHEKGLLAGIWLAPFVAEKDSRVFKEHYDWIKKDEKNMPIRCGSSWSGFYALDLDNEEVTAYIKKCLNYYVELGFDFFKLDFLYAASRPQYKGKTRSMAAEGAYSLLRETLKDKLILGCGATVFNCINRFEYLRVGPDVSLKFDDEWFMHYMHRERISTKITIQNTVFRSFMNGRFFGNDPDVFLLRNDNIDLNDEQKKSLATINALFGSVMMTSDDVSTYDEKQKSALDNASDLFYNAKVLNYEGKNGKIEITYKLHGKEKSIVYDVNRGVIDER